MGMSTSQKTALVASALAMTLAASVFAAAPAQAAPTPTIPSNIALKKKDVRHLKLDTLFDLGVVQGGLVTFAGQYCDTTDNGATGTEPLPGLGRWWTWYNAANDTDVSVDQVVTSWSDAPAAMADLATDTGLCRVGALDYPNYTVVHADADEFVATWDDAAVSARLVGPNTIVAITVRDWNNRIDEVTEAGRLLDIAAAHAAKSKKLP